MVRAEKTLVDIKEQSSTILHAQLLFQVDKCIYVHEHLQENMIHQGIVDLECIMVDSIQALLIHLEVQLSVNNGGSGDQLFINVQVSTISR